MECLPVSLDANAFINPHSLDFEFLIITINILQKDLQQQKHLPEFPFYFNNKPEQQQITNELIRQNSNSTRDFLCWSSVNNNIQNELLLQQQQNQSCINTQNGKIIKYFLNNKLSDYV